MPPKGKVTLSKGKNALAKSKAKALPKSKAKKNNSFGKKQGSQSQKQ